MILPQIVMLIAKIGEQSDATMARTRPRIGDVHHRAASAGGKSVAGAVWRDGLAPAPPSAILGLQHQTGSEINA
jgi:hypothetical protein